MDTAPPLADPRHLSPQRRRRLVRTLGAVGLAMAATGVAGAFLSAGSGAPGGGTAAAAAAAPSAGSSAGTVLTGTRPPGLDRRGELPASRSQARAGGAPDIVRDGRTVAGWKFGDDGLLWPVPGAKTTALTGWRVHPVYGYRSCHTGVDIAGTWGTPILAAQAGVVTLVKNEGAFGRHTVVKHANGLSTMYAHQDQVLVHVGEQVSRGQVIGKVGSSGWVTGPHLHFEVHRSGLPYDPLAWFLSNHPERPVGCAHRMPY